MSSAPLSSANNTPDGLACVEHGVFVTHHARVRLQEHFPNMGVRGALTLLSRSEEIAPGVAAALTGRSLAGVQDCYFLTPDRRGLMVLARPARADGFAWCMVTYLRFGDRQADVAARLYPQAA
jgi:hypothetical protein